MCDMLYDILSMCTYALPYILKTFVLLCVILTYLNLLKYFIV